MTAVPTVTGSAETTMPVTGTNVTQSGEGTGENTGSEPPPVPPPPADTGGQTATPDPPPPPDLSNQPPPEGDPGQAPQGSQQTPTITGFSRHALDKIIDESVKPNWILDAVRNPLRIRPGRGDVTLYIGRWADVRMNSSGNVVTVIRLVAVP
jgi:hypothetical protein